MCDFKPESGSLSQLAQHYTSTHTAEILQIFSLSYVKKKDKPIPHVQAIATVEGTKFKDATMPTLPTQPKGTTPLAGDSSNVQVVCGYTDCDARFVSSVDFYCHMDQDHEQASIRDALCRCTVCNDVMDVDTMIRHQEEGCNLCCPKCGSTFPTAEDFDLHSAENCVHMSVAPTDSNDPTKPSVPVQCDICGVVSTSESNHNIHLENTACGSHGSRPHKCSACNMAFTELADLNEHMELAHGEYATYPCPICSYSNADLEQCVDHARGHFKEFVSAKVLENVECFICGIQTTSKMYITHLKHHFQYKTGPHHCRTCTSGLKSFQEAKQHFKDHDWSLCLPTGVEPFQCRVCQAKFMGLTDIISHMNKHYGSYRDSHTHTTSTSDGGTTSKRKPKESSQSVSTICPLCEFQSPFSNVMTKHAKSHFNNDSLMMRIHHCLICLTSFTSKGRLVKHLSTMHFSKAGTVARCAKCNLVLANVGHASDHVNIHHQLASNVKAMLTNPSQCLVCLEPIQSLDDLMNHMRAHSSRTSKQCDICDANLVSNDDFLYHGETSCSQYKCGICGVDLDSREALKRHLNEKHSDVCETDLHLEYQCPPCNASFCSTAEYEDHIEKIHLKHALCILCFAAFDSVEECVKHLTVHYAHGRRVSMLSHVCLFCGDLIKSEEEAVNHASAHYKPNLNSESVAVECKHCGQYIPSYEDAKAHYMEHVKDPTSEQVQKVLMCCLFCNVETLTCNGVMMHMESHFTSNNKLTEKKIYARCLKCRYITSRVYGLVYHCRNKHGVSSITDGINRMTYRAPFNCHFCSMTFYNKARYKRHISNTENSCEGKVYQCECCSFIARDIAHFDDHVSEKHRDKDGTYKCKPCAAVFAFKGDFLGHLESRWASKHDEKGQIMFYMCNHCDERFSTKDALLSHHQMLKKSFYHTSKHKSQACCPECHSRVSNLEMHQRKAHHVRSCTICDFVTTSGDLLSQHMMEYHSEKVYCKVCKLSFGDEAGLQHHLTVMSRMSDIDPGIVDLHLMEYNEVMSALPSKTAIEPVIVICRICRREFRHRKHLESHMANVHSVAIECRYCDKTFVDDDSLDLHMDRDHAERKLPCPHCTARFINKGGLMSHIKIKHPDISDKEGSNGNNVKPYECSNCGERFANLAGHLKSGFCGRGPHKCDQCSKSFQSKTTLWRHTKQSHKPSHDSVVRKDKAIAIVSSTRSRGGRTKQHECEKCGAKFSMSTTLQQHVEEEHGEDSEEEIVSDSSGDDAVISDDEDYDPEEDLDESDAKNKVAQGANKSADGEKDEKKGNDGGKKVGRSKTSGKTDDNDELDSSNDEQGDKGDEEETKDDRIDRSKANVNVVDEANGDKEKEPCDEMKAVDGDVNIATEKNGGAEGVESKQDVGGEKADGNSVADQENKAVAGSAMGSACGLNKGKKPAAYDVEAGSCDNDDGHGVSRKREDEKNDKATDVSAGDANNAVEHGSPKKDQPLNDEMAKSDDAGNLSDDGNKLSMEKICDHDSQTSVAAGASENTGNSKEGFNHMLDHNYFSRRRPYNDKNDT